LAWKLALHLEPNTTCQLLAEAAKHLPAGSDATSVVADSGVENVNEKVNAWFDAGPLRRVLAQVEVSFSNSLIEAWWRSLKHGWLYLHQPDTLAALEKLIGFYVEQHNSVVPHAAFAGQTPDEMYFGRGDHVPGELAAGHARARAARLESNRRLSCGASRPSVHDPPGLPDRSANSRMLQMRKGMSGMSCFAAG
jgi:putative transposase